MDDLTLSQMVDNAVGELLNGQAARTVSHDRAAHVLSILAQRVAVQAADMALSSLLTTDTVATILNVIPRRVRALAKARGVGWQVSRGTWIFRPDDVEKLRPYAIGRPRKESR